METAKRIIVVMAVVLMTTGIAVSDESKISGTRTASCLIKIISDPTILPLDDTTIDYLLHSSGVAGKAVRDVLGQMPPEDDEIFDLEQALQIEYLADEGDMSLRGVQNNSSPETESDEEYDLLLNEPNRNRSRRTYGDRITGDGIYEQMILLRIQVNFREEDIMLPVKPAAVEFMKAVIVNLETTLSQAFNEQRKRLNKRLYLAEEEALRTEDELNQMQTRLREIAGSHILVKDNILDNITNMRRDIQNIEMEKVSDQVIVEAITERIAETQAKLREQIENDEVTGQMQQIVDNQIRQVEVTKQRYKNGVVREESIAEAEEKLARARIELAQRREQMNRTAGGDLIESLNRELADRSVQATQNQAKLNALNRQLEEAEHWLDKSDDHELLSLKAEIAKQNLREVLIWRDRISRQIRLIQPPSVTVLGD